MKDMMTHRGYYGSVGYDDEDRIFYGKIEFIRALVSYDPWRGAGKAVKGELQRPYRSRTSPKAGPGRRS